MASRLRTAGGKARLGKIDQPFSLERVVTGKGETRTDEFKKINPKGRLPVLTKADWMLTEIPAILLHLASENIVFAPKGKRKTLEH